ncbi:predicted protein [Naegleria gruberi]|uniref:Predicted protein n=1 Tax=Naegleria gruberi TaxID=5762 RepID=D2VYR7_NAEGR|nr:uncharacterized protein NAEGRDRAFT_81737 [Naegleria gruberi]EFC37959.1 predicted protein [Naegleria gruberi]|eukprot:XP_002670703.1 predicted protein [Naegleria gruberi strain NEG-M]
MALYYQQYYNASQLNNSTNQNNHNNFQLPVYEGSYLHPYSKLSSDGCSNLILSQYAAPNSSPISLGEITQITNEVNTIVDQVYNSVKMYDYIYWTTFIISMVLAIPTMGLSVFGIIFVMFLPMMKAQKIITKLNNVAKPQIQQVLERKNQERFEPAGLQWCVGYRQILVAIVANRYNNTPKFETSIDISLRPVLRQPVVMVVQQPQPVYNVPQPMVQQPFNPNQQPIAAEQK